MALSAFLSVDKNCVSTNENVSFSLQVLNPSGGSAVSVTSVIPYYVIDGTTPSRSCALPMVPLPSGPRASAVASSIYFSWQETFFTPNGGTASQSYTVGCNIITSDGALTTPSTLTITVSPTGVAPPAVGSLDARANYDSALLAAVFPPF